VKQKYKDTQIKGTKVYKAPYIVHLAGLITAPLVRAQVECLTCKSN